MPKTSTPKTPIKTAPASSAASVKTSTAVVEKPTKLKAATPTIAKAASAKTAIPKTATTKTASAKSGGTRGKQTRQRIRPETRDQMMERLLNPEISLHEASVLLAVCRATVRRYADSDALVHRRTEGNQRRFQFRDVLALSRTREAEKLERKRRYRRASK